MNAPMILLSVFATVFLFILPILIFIIWLKTYRSRAIIIKECGPDENDSTFHIIKCKSAKDDVLGEIIRFFPMSGMKLSKNFDSTRWTSIKEKKRLRDGIIIYKQGENYRPVELKKENDKYFLNVADENNRKFYMQYEMMKQEKNRSMSIIKVGVISFFVFAAFFGVVYVLSVLEIMRYAQPVVTNASMVVLG